MKRITFIFMAILLIGLTGCEKDDPAKKLNFPSLSIIDNSSNFKSASSTKSSDVEGFYIGDLEIIGHHYRPGETIQNRPQDAPYVLGIPRDWSYFKFLPNGSTKTSNLLLTQSGEIKIQDLLFIDYYDDPWFYLDSAYVEKVDSFTLDILEVNFLGTGVVKNNKFYGSFLNNAYGGHPLYKYPQFSSIPYFQAYTYFPGIEDHAFTVSYLFVSEKYISTPVQIIVDQVGQDDYGIFTYEISKTTRPLITDEEEFVLNFLENVPSRASYYLNFIPFKGEKKWKFTDDSFLTTIKISVDLNNIVDDRTDFNAIEAIPEGGPYQYDPLYYNTDSNYIPFGLKVIF